MVARHRSSKNSSRGRCTTGVTTTILILTCGVMVTVANPDAKRLYDDLLSNYNKLVRPVANVSDALTVKIKLKLSQLIDVNLKNQIMTTNLWVEQYWYDYKLQWNPADYGGVDMLNIPSENIWRPDIVLYNNADGNFEVTLSTKATMYHSGLIEWKPPAIYKSSCEIDVEYFPFDEQTCVLKFGSWTYDGFQVDLRHLEEKFGSTVVEMGVDLSEFYMSVEWDILAVPATRNMKFYTCCDEPYLDITFNITMRRKTLFYTVNLIIPCIGITFLTVLVFYLPSDSGEKVSLAISILLSLTVFFLLLAEIIPPTSLVVPLLGKFVLFTMILDTFSICVTVVVLNVHFRSPQTHTMSPWVRRVFIHILPRLLIMRRPLYAKFSSNPRMNSLIYRSCHNGVIESGDYWNQQGLEHQSCTRSSTELFDSTADLNTSRSTKDETFSRDATSSMFNGPCQLHGSAGFISACAVDADDALLTPTGSSSRYVNSSVVTGITSTSAMHAGLRPRSGPPPLSDLPQPCSADRCLMSPGLTCPDVYMALEGVQFLAEHTRREQYTIRVREDWKYVAMVLDRLFLWIFTTAVLLGTAAIILQAPTLYDDRIPIDIRLSEIAAGALGKAAAAAATPPTI
ncbi:acetylcholine receptor subunit alpha-like [Daphnia magna]|uniref:acetylcholine receptor subunit alpha-like n=1 Tax=Daphnia magna TaxID=35525 RepID=UPI001E1BA5F0|nr:acetylcholine receptor subunit alpha-like [Daphnia magna]